MKSPDTVLSLIISTRNRASSLSRTLKSLGRLRTALTWELVIVDNESSDDTQAILKDFAATFRGAIQLVSEPRRGLANARNAGCRAAGSPIYVFTDDDCYPSPEYLNAMSLCFSEDSGLGFVGGRILPWSNDSCRITIQESADRAIFAPFSFIPAGVIQGANFACRRAAIQAVGGFDPRFGSGSLFSAEEIELLARISAAGWKGAYDPRPVVYHDHGRKKGWDEWRIMRSYDRGRGGYYAKCVLNKGMRTTYLLNWWRMIRKQSWKTSALELVSGLEFIIRAALRGKSLGDTTTSHVE